MRTAAKTNLASSWTTIFLLQTCLITLLMVAEVVYSASVFEISEATALQLLSIALLLICVWTLWSWRVLSGGIFNLYGLFVISTALFNGGQIFLHLLNPNLPSPMNDVLSLFNLFSVSTQLETTFLVTISIASLHFGALISLLISSRRRLGKDEKDLREPSVSHLATMRLVGWLCLVMSAVPVLVVLKESLAVVLTHGYLGLFQTGSSSNVNKALYILSFLLVPGIMFLLAGSKVKGKVITFNAWFCTGLVLLYASTQFFIGDRHSAAMLLIAYAWVFSRCIRRLPKSLLIGFGGVMLFIVFPVVSVFRNASGTGRSLSSLFETFTSINNPAVAIIYEMGSTAGTVAYTIDLVPGSRPFDLGTSYFYAMLSIIPSVFWSKHPTAVHGTLDNWLVDTVNPLLATFQGNSYGFSFIAEAYLNFGWIFAPVAVAIIGFLIAWLSSWGDHTNNPARVAVVGTSIAFLLMFARGESNDMLRPLVWYALIPYLGVYLLETFARSANSLSKSGTMPQNPRQREKTSSSPR